LIRDAQDASESQPESRPASRPARTSVFGGRDILTPPAGPTATSEDSPPAAAPSATSGGSGPEGTQSAEGSGAFVRSSDPRAPHLVRFSHVPESAKYPAGPYKQAPPEAGGDWWFVNPFTGPEPWLQAEAFSQAEVVVEPEPLPAGFVEAFGARPEREDFTSFMQFKTAVAQWEMDLSYYKGTGIPEGFNEEQVEAASSQFEAWGLGKPVFYEGRYGWQVTFPDSQLPSFETTASTALITPHMVIAQFQVRSIQEGITPGRFHPWLPEQLRA
jgi:hypothetical protein